MKITWLGHACFQIEHEGYRLLLDPYRDVPGWHDVSAEAELVLCSHEHFDHSFRRGVTLRLGQENPFAVETMHTFHDACGGALRGENTVHILRAAGLTLVHLGDLGHRLDEEQAERLRGCDVLFVPVGGTYTLDGDGAADVAEQIAPGLIVPMHYRGADFGFDDIAELAPFLRRFSPERVIRLSGNTFTPAAYGSGQVLVPAAR